jgi:hypothetical protein
MVIFQMSKRLMSNGQDVHLNRSQLAFAVIILVVSLLGAIVTQVQMDSCVRGNTYYTGGYRYENDVVAMPGVMPQYTVDPSTGKSTSVSVRSWTASASATSASYPTSYSSSPGSANGYADATPYYYGDSYYYGESSCRFSRYYGAAMIIINGILVPLFSVIHVILFSIQCSRLWTFASDERTKAMMNMPMALHAVNVQQGVPMGVHQDGTGRVVHVVIPPEMTGFYMPQAIHGGYAAVPGPLNTPAQQSSSHRYGASGSRNAATDALILRFDTADRILRFDTMPLSKFYFLIFPI